MSDLVKYEDPTALALPSGLGFDEWQSVGEHLARIERGVSWWYGDWWAYEGHSHSDALQDGLTADELPAYQTLRNLGSVAARFPVSRRRDSLSFSHHAEVAKLAPAVADAWLDQAEEHGWSIRELRAELKASAEGSPEEGGPAPTAAPSSGWRTRKLPAVRKAAETIPDAVDGSDWNNDEAREAAETRDLLRKKALVLDLALIGRSRK